MNSSDDKNTKKGNHPFDHLSDKDLKRIFDEMRDYIESDSFKELVEDIINNSYLEKQEIDGLFDFEVNEDESYTADIDHTQEDNFFVDDHSVLNKPTADIMKDDTHVMITISLPFIKRDHISLYATESDIEIVVTKGKHTLYDIIDLPALVKPNTATSSYNNGVLDILIERKKCWHSGLEIDIK